MAGAFWDPVQTGYEGADYADNPWDTLYFSGPQFGTVGSLQLPGICDVTARGARAFDRKKAAGVHGRTDTSTGYQPAKVEIKVRIWTPRQYVLIQAALIQIWPRWGKLPIPPDSAGSIALSNGFAVAGSLEAAQSIIAQAAAAPAVANQAQEAPAFDVTHPKLNDIGIRQIKITGVSTPSKGTVTQEQVYAIEAEEYFPPLPKKKGTETPKPKTPAAPEATVASFQPPSGGVAGVDYTPANATQSLPSTDSTVTGP